MGRERRPCVGLARCNKDQARRTHAGRRLLERFGLRYTARTEAAVLRQIESGEALHGGGNVDDTVYLVTLPDGARARAVYDIKRRCIVTFLHEKPGNEEAP